MLNSANTYLFYDIETTGLHKCFDQVLQFAAIRTDLELNELERYETFVRLNPDVIPSPYALIIHRIDMNTISQGENELEVIAKIHKLFNCPGTISVGYNTLGFDDEFLRFSFYRHLLAPYTHQYANNCSRMDLYPITILYYLYNNDTLNWPTNHEKINLKLENLIEFNQLVQGNAHHAMVDVEATLALARLFIKHRKMWEYAIAYFDKQQDLSRINQLPIAFETSEHIFREAILLQGRLGADIKYHAPVLSLGQHYHYKNQTLWLRLDTPNLLNVTEENLNETTYVIRKKIAEQEILLPFNERFSKHIDNDRLEITKKNKQWLQKNISLLEKIRHHYLNFQYPFVENRDIACALYDIGFPQRYEEILFSRFHLAPPENKAEIAQQITNPIYRELAFRIIGNHFSDHQSASSQLVYEEYLAKALSQNPNNCIFDHLGGKKLTIHQALQEITAIRDTLPLDEEQKKLLCDYEQYLLHLA